MLLAEKETRAIAERALGFVKAGDAVVTVQGRVHSHLRFAANAFQTNGHSESVGVTVRVWVDRKRGEAFTSDSTDASLKHVAEQAEAIARLAPVDVEYLPTLGQQSYKPTAAFSEATATVSLSDRARQIHDAIVASEKAGVISAGFHQTDLTSTGSATRNGNVTYQRTSLVSLGVTSRPPDGSSSGYFLRSQVDVSRLDTGGIAREAIRRALESRNARSIPPGRYPVILEPQAVADLMGGIYIFDARASDEGRGAFSGPGGKTRVGERVFDERINILSDPWHPALPGNVATDEGIPSERFHLVRNGVLETLVNRRFWASQNGRPATPGPANTILESSAAPVTVDDMIKASDRALLVSRFWYIRIVDPRTAALTGLTRDGVWMVENGRIQHPVRNLRINQSIIQMLAPGNVEMIGGSERVGASESQGQDAGLYPALKLRAFNFTSQSEAV
jgi:predicted Zn-dependent protease